MKNNRAVWLNLIAKILDPLLLIASVPSALILKAYRKGGGQRFPLTTSVLKRIGIMPVIKHYYEPFYDTAEFPESSSKIRFLPGINFGVSEQLKFLETLSHSAEIIEIDFTKTPKTVSDFQLGNGRFENGDAEFLYQFIRSAKPKKMIEIGSGFSTKVASLAHLKNAAELKVKTKHICVEPFEMEWLEKLDGIEVIRSRVENVKIDWKTELSIGDFLFIDSTHVIRPHGDVLKEYLEILPQLASGVYVHIHDIFSPRDYLDRWQKSMNFWNEQYLLEAMLSNNSRYEVIAALNLLKHDHFKELLGVCPYLTPECEPGSIYLKIK